MPSPAAIAEAIAYLTPEERAELDALLPPVRPPLLDRRFAEQCRFVEDPSRFKAMLGTRRAAKSLSIALAFLVDAEQRPGANYLYLGLTRDSAKGAIWKDGFKLLNDRNGLGLKFNEADLSVTTPNAATVYVYGLDTGGERLKERLRGRKLRGAAVDEAQSFGIDLQTVVTGILRPALLDQRGTLIVAGTPGEVEAGLFFDLTGDLDPQRPGVVRRSHRDTAAEWSVHYWNAAANPHVREQWLEEEAAMLAVNPRIAETPIYMRERLGRWVRDEENLVYRYRPGRNDYDPETEGPEAVPQKDKRWRYVIACDLGFNDPTALGLLAYNDADRTLYVARAREWPGLDVSDVAARTHELATGHDIDAYVIDGANKQAVEEMRRRHGIPWIAADKAGKSDFIEIMNAEFIRGAVKVNRAACTWGTEGREKGAPDSLSAEYGALIWDKRALNAPKPRREEHPSCANHATDMVLYGWRHCFQYLARAPEPRPVHGSREWAEAEERRMIENAVQKRRRDADEWGSNGW
jgi:hypothetical protein